MAEVKRPLIFSTNDKEGRYIPARIHDYWWGVPVLCLSVTLIIVGLVILAVEGILQWMK